MAEWHEVVQTWEGPGAGNSILEESLWEENNGMTKSIDNKRIGENSPRNRRMLDVKANGTRLFRSRTKNVKINGKARKAM